MDVCCLPSLEEAERTTISVDVFFAGFNDIVNETFKVGANAHNPAMLRVVAKDALFLAKHIFNGFQQHPV